MTSSYSSSSSSLLQKDSPDEDDEEEDEIKFIVVDVKYPRKGILPPDWDGYAIARIKLMKVGSKTAKKVKDKKIFFKGSLHSLDYAIVYVVKKPMLVFDTERLCYNLMVNKYGGRLTFECAKLTQSVLIKLLCIISNRCSPKRSYFRRTKQQWALEVNRKRRLGLLQKKKFNLLEIQKYVFPPEEINPIDWLLSDYCHLWRLKELLPCVPSEKVMQCKTIAPSKISDLKRVFNNTPWLLCLPNYMDQRYGLRPFTFKDVVSIVSAPETSLKTREIWGRQPFSQNYLRESTRLIDWLIKRRKQSKDTLLSVSSQFSNSFIYKQITGYLVRMKEALFIDATRLVLKKDRSRAESLLNKVKRMMYPAVVCKTLSLERFSAGKGFTPCQLKAISLMQNSSFCVITGKPGTGKTHTIGCITDYARVTGDIKILVVSFIGRMVNSLRKRLKNDDDLIDDDDDMGEGGDIYSLHQKVIIGTINGALEHIDEGSHFDVLVIDEAANIGISLMLRLLQRFCVDRLVLVMDPDQVPPISYGWPAVDLMNIYPKNHIQLKQNMRLDPSSLYIADMYDAVLQGTFDKDMGTSSVWFSSQSFKMVRGNDNPNVKMVTRPSRNYCRKRSVREAFPLLNEDMLLSKLEYILFHCLECSAGDFHKWQFLCFTRNVVSIINNAIIKLLKRKRVLQCFDVVDSVFIRDGFSLFPGQKFTSLVNVKAKKVSSSQNAAISSSIQNGEVQIVTEIEVIGNKHYVRCQGGKFFLLDKGFLDKEKVVPAYATTVNKYQGSECDNVVLVAIPESENLEFIDRRHVYVAISRARKRFIALSSPKYFHSLARLPLKKKNTYLSQLN